MRRGKSTLERDAAKLAEGFKRAQDDLATCEEGLRAAEETTEQEKRGAGLARAIEEIGEEEYAQRVADAEARRAIATAARDRARDVLESVRGPAADAAEAVENAKLEAATADVLRTAQAREEAEAMVVKLAADEALAEERLAIVERMAADARAPFSEVAAVDAERRRESDRRKVLWHVQERHDPSHPDIAPWLREDVAAEVARRERENEQYKQRRRERADRVGTGGDPFSIPQREPFPVLDQR